MCKAKEIVDKVTNIYDESRELTKRLTQHLSEVDKEIQDVLHFMEFQKFNVVQGYHFAKQLQELQIKRRKIKDELEPMQIIMNSFLARDVQSLNDKMNAKLKKMDEREYKPKVLKILK